MENYLNQKRRLINQSLNKYLIPSSTFPKEIHQAMRYSVLNGGKRLRAILSLMVGELLHTPNSKIIPFACSLEMIHSYSLIHDDLPAMDNDDFRRGKPTCHKVFGEAIAILAGDALLTYAFQIIADEIHNKSIVPKLISELAQSAGSRGMVGGQVLDITQERKAKSVKRKAAGMILREMHLRKTAAMIIVAARGAGIISNASPKALTSITSYARNFGLAFQIIDDILDVKGSLKQLGKTPGKDTKHNKLTYPYLKGLDDSYKEATHLIQLSKKSLDIFGKRAERLKEFADYLLTRKA
ncbi:MAG: farnesyl diphosphate synthase [Planctomycetota bacterium]